MEADPELPTLLQREWDLRLQHTQIFLILSGSIQSVIQQQVLRPDRAALPAAHVAFRAEASDPGRSAGLLSRVTRPSN